MSKTFIIRFSSTTSHIVHRTPHLSLLLFYYSRFSATVSLFRSTRPRHCVPYSAIIIWLSVYEFGMLFAGDNSKVLYYDESFSVFCAILQLVCVHFFCFVWCAVYIFSPTRPFMYHLIASGFFMHTFWILFIKGTSYLWNRVFSFQDVG